MSNTALVTGASGGIGKELAKLHAQMAGDVVLVARSEDDLNQLKKELEAKYMIKATVITADLAKPGSASEIFKQTEEQNIQIDVLINNFRRVFVRANCGTRFGFYCLGGYLCVCFFLSIFYSSENPYAAGVS